MSEIINNSRQRVEQLKELLKEVNEKGLPKSKALLKEMLGSVPYGEVVQAEQELISEGMSAEEIQKHCDLHSEALREALDISMSKQVPEGHPVHTFIMENRELSKLTARLKQLEAETELITDETDVPAKIDEVRSILNALTDIEKHYSRKENLLFPFLEKYNITGPPMVMWGKDDEVRMLLKSSLASFGTTGTTGAAELKGFFELLFIPAAKAVEEMIYKEEKILFPMSVDTLTEIDWYDIYSQSASIGFCLCDPQTEWKPEGEIVPSKKESGRAGIELSTGSFNYEELEALFSALPVDLTFVDKEDKVKYFSHGKDRIFERNRAILGRQVQYCHPPSSVHIVDKILSDFKSGAQNEAKFWINFKGMLVHIAYYAVRDKNGSYLGTLEVTQDIQEFQNTAGERRLLTYDK